VKNIWILTEENPKNNVIQTILSKVADDQNFAIRTTGLRIVPIIQNDRFIFVYRVEGVTCEGFENIFIKIASGNSSFVDFLVFLQEKEPDQSSMPLYAIEETKTDDSESRNTGVYQRCSKFVYVEFFYPGIKKIMLYNLQIKQKAKATETNIFGTRMLRTIGVEILGKVYDEEMMKPFSSLDELVRVKKAMRLPYGENIPIQIEIHSDRITVSGKLYKAGRLGHDPNIGALTIIALCIRKWEKTKDIVITRHGLKQQNVGEDNKFTQIANRLNIKLEGLNLPVTTNRDSYWHYEQSQEKMATIFLHVSLIAYTNAKIIYANHGGSERGYFFDKNGIPIAVPKYQLGKRALYKFGDKLAIIHLPDIVVFDPSRDEIISVEGKKYVTRKLGITELRNYSYIEKRIINPTYNPKVFIRTVVIFGSSKISVVERQIGLLLNEQGQIILGKRSPAIFVEAVKKLLSSQNK